MSNQNSGPPPGWPAPSESPYGPGKTVVGEPLAVDAGSFPPPGGGGVTAPANPPGVSATVVDGGPGATAGMPNDWEPKFERMPAPVYGAPPPPYQEQPPF